MPFSKEAISSVSAATMPLASSVAFSRSEIARSRPFFSSSALSSEASQYAFLSSSSACSFFNSATISSIMATTFSKPAVRLRRARATKSRRASRFAACSARSACRRTSLDVTCVCSREGLGRVFLKSSNASSEFRILMVSARAKSSSALVFWTTSHSAFLALQFLSRSARKDLSSARDFVVSSRSSLRVSISIPTCPARSSFDSIALVLALISASFAVAAAS
mmetsp:Transcript_93822/g.261194  ORF Transcript_93822/g.261194 Transcript_93822/m.261194 type:complete len:222 (-) Transcript_93822:132-797(-)